MLTKKMEEDFSKLELSEKLLRLMDMKNVGLSMLLIEVAKRDGVITEDQFKQMADIAVEYYHNIAADNETYMAIMKRGSELAQTLLPPEAMIEGGKELSAERRAKMN